MLRLISLRLQLLACGRNNWKRMRSSHKVDQQLRDNIIGQSLLLSRGDSPVYCTSFRDGSNAHLRGAFKPVIPRLMPRPYPQLNIVKHLIPSQEKTQLHVASLVSLWLLSLVCGRKGNGRPGDVAQKGLVWLARTPHYLYIYNYLLQ